MPPWAPLGASLGNNPPPARARATATRPPHFALPEHRARACGRQRAPRARSALWNGVGPRVREVVRACVRRGSLPPSKRLISREKLVNVTTLPTMCTGRSRRVRIFLHLYVRARARQVRRPLVRVRASSGSFFLWVGDCRERGVFRRHTQNRTPSLSRLARPVPLASRGVPPTAAHAKPSSPPSLRAFFLFCVGSRSSGSSSEPKGSVRSGACLPARCVRAPTPSRAHQPAPKSPRYIPSSSLA